MSSDADQLAELGYTSEFKRDMSLWANFAPGFTYLSPESRALRRFLPTRHVPPYAMTVAAIVPAIIVLVSIMLYGVLAMINIAWPRTPNAPWYDNWIVSLGAAIVIGVGLLYMAIGKPHERGGGLAGDAIAPPQEGRSTTATTTGAPS